MRDFTFSEKVVLWFAPMFMKYRVLEKISDEGHARSVGRGSSPGLFGLWWTDSVSLDWKDRSREDIYINRFPLTEIILFGATLYFMFALIWDVSQLWEAILAKFGV